MDTIKYSSRIFRIFILFSLGFFLTSIFRTVNAVLGPVIESELQMSSHIFALITSAYFFSFALMQLPTGVLVDHYGPRRVQSSFFLIAAIGTILFALGKGPLLLGFGRILIGAGMAGGLMSAFAANRIWFYHNEVPLLNNLTLTIGALGALTATVPVQILLEMVSWRLVMLGTAFLTLLMASLIAIFVPDPPKHSYNHIGQVIRGIKHVAIDPFFWRVAPLCALILGFITALQSFWLIPFLQHVNNIPPSEGSYYLLVIAASMVIGPIFTNVSVYGFRKIGIPMHVAVAVKMLIAILLQVLITFDIADASYLLWFFIGLTRIASLSFYSVIGAHFPKEYVARASTLLNMVCFFTIFVIQYLFGVIVSVATGPMKQRYLIAFGVFLILEVLAFIWYLVGKGQFREEH